jgi:hypothetical protein
MNIIIGWPEGIYLALNLICVGILAARHGQPKIETEDLWGHLIPWVFITLPLLYWGGFFS